MKSLLVSISILVFGQAGAIPFGGFLDLTQNPEWFVQMESLRQKRQDVAVLTDAGSAGCVTGCLGPMLGATSHNQPQPSQPQACPTYEPDKMEALCLPFRQARTCLDACPDGQVKQFTLRGFKPLEFMCIERREDFKKHMPCLTSACDRVQRQCEPVCGDLDESVRQLTRVQQEARVRGAGLDAPDVMGAMGDSCRLIGCISNCSRAPWTEACGPEAYALQRDTILAMLGHVAQAMAQAGLEDVWPRPCQTLLASPLDIDPPRDNRTIPAAAPAGQSTADRGISKSHASTRTPAAAVIAFFFAAAVLF